MPVQLCLTFALLALCLSACSLESEFVVVLGVDLSDEGPVVLAQRVVSDGHGHVEIGTVYRFIMGEEAAGDPECHAHLFSPVEQSVSTSSKGVVFQSGTELYMALVRRGGAGLTWSVFRDDGNELTAMATGVGSFSRFWRAEDGVLRFFADDGIYEQVGLSFSRVHSAPPDCQCDFLLPTGAVEGVVGYVQGGEVRMERLSCEAGSTCRLSGTGTTIGLFDSAGGLPSGPYVFESSDGPVFLRHVTLPTTDGSQRLEIEVTTSDTRRALGDRVYVFDAVQRSIGGYAIASAHPEGRLGLTLVNAFGVSRVIDLGSHPREGRQIRLLTAGSTPEEEVIHIYFGSGENQIRELRVEPETGRIQTRDVTTCE